MNRQLTSQVVGALIRRGDEVLLVQQQGPNDPVPGWALPGGVVEAGELLTEALAREVREETGLLLGSSGQLVYVAQVYDPATSGVGTAFVFEGTEWTGDLSAADPDDLILDVRFLPVAEAVARLQMLPARRMREPIAAYLRGEVDRGAIWCYRRQPNGEDALIAILSSTPGLPAENRT